MSVGRSRDAFPPRLAVGHVIPVRLRRAPWSESQRWVKSGIGSCELFFTRYAFPRVGASPRGGVRVGAWCSRVFLGAPSGRLTAVYSRGKGFPVSSRDRNGKQPLGWGVTVLTVACREEREPLPRKHLPCAGGCAHRHEVSGPGRAGVPAVVVFAVGVTVERESPGDCRSRSGGCLVRAFATRQLLDAALGEGRLYQSELGR